MPGAWPITAPDSPVASDNTTTIYTRREYLRKEENLRLDLSGSTKKTTLWYEIFGKAFDALKFTSRDTPDVLANGASKDVAISSIPTEDVTAELPSSPLIPERDAVTVQLPTPPPSRNENKQEDEGPTQYFLFKEIGTLKKTENDFTYRDGRERLPGFRRLSDASDISVQSSTKLFDGDTLDDLRFHVSDYGEESKRTRNRSAVQDPLREIPLIWEDKVAQAVKVGHGHFTPSTIRRVLPSGHGSSSEGWLNDDSVNEYLTLIAKYYNKSRGIEPGQRPPACHSFGSFFMQSLKTRGPSSMSSWARRAKLQGARLLEADLIFFPICEHNHWTLVALFPRDRCVKYYDSMGGVGATYTSRLRAFLESHLGKTFNAGEWRFDKGSTPCPQQDNGIDCGVFAVLAAKYLSLNLELTYSAKDIPLQRKIMVGELIKGDLFGAAPLVDGF
ncbi:MAG: hypothetical protein Q9160_001651 [Pyrenula sp. 1 TL-2023]